MVSIFRKTYERFWGPRTDDILRAAVLTLLRHQGTTLCDVPILLLDRGVRSRLTKHLDDPIGLRPFWQEYEAWSPGFRTTLAEYLPSLTLPGESSRTNAADGGCAGAD